MKPLLFVAIFALPQLAGYYMFATRGATSDPNAAYAAAALYFATPERAVSTIARLAAARDWPRLSAYCDAGCANLADTPVLAETGGARYLSHIVADDVITVKIETSAGEAMIYLQQYPKGLRLTTTTAQR
ncbi:MAG: hypothetical protein AAGC95_14235 [Pseudomonadota bacterium]